MMIAKRFSSAVLTALSAALLCCGCTDEGAGRVREAPAVKESKQPSVAVTSSEHPSTRPPPPPTERRPAPDRPTQEERPVIRRTPQVRPPQRPSDGWAIFREAFKPLEDAACDAQWTGDNRLVVETTNIRGLTLDLNKLPAGAPRRGPWNLQLDGQGIEITGFRGKVVDFIRSKNGVWTVDRSRRKIRH